MLIDTPMTYAVVTETIVETKSPVPRYLARCVLQLPDIVSGVEAFSASMFVQCNGANLAVQVSYTPSHNPGNLVVTIECTEPLTHMTMRIAHGWARATLSTVAIDVPESYERKPVPRLPCACGVFGCIMHGRLDFAAKVH